MYKQEKLCIVENTLFQPSELTIENKKEIAKALNTLKIDVIPLPLTSESADIGQNLDYTTVCIPCKPTQQDVMKAKDLIESFNKKRIRLTLDDSLLKDIDLQEKRDRDDVIKLVKDAIDFTKTFCEDIEFFIPLTDRLHKIFIYKLIEEAYDHGARTATITDKCGHMLTSEYGKLFADIIENTPDLDDLRLGAVARNTLGIANAGIIAAVENGARQVDLNIHNFHCSDGYASLIYLLKAIDARNDALNVYTELNKEAYEETYTFVKSFFTPKH